MVVKETKWTQTAISRPEEQDITHIEGEDRYNNDLRDSLVKQMEVYIKAETN